MLLNIEDLSTSVGTDLGVSRWIVVDQQRIDGFASTTEDRNWLHVDRDRAARGPFGATIAHGFLTLALMAAFLEDLLTIGGASTVLNYGLERVRFPAPVRVGSRLRAHGRIVDATGIPGGVQVLVGLTAEADGLAKPACVADMLSRAYR